MKFKEGDLITGNKDNSYEYTSKDSICKVLLSMNKEDCDHNDIYVELSNNVYYPNLIGKKWWVTSSKFKLVEPAKPLTEIELIKTIGYKNKRRK